MIYVIKTHNPTLKRDAEIRDIYLACLLIAEEFVAFFELFVYIRVIRGEFFKIFLC